MELNKIVEVLEETLAYLNDYNVLHYPNESSVEAIQLEEAYQKIREGKEDIEYFLED